MRSADSPPSLLSLALYAGVKGRMYKTHSHIYLLLLFITKQGRILSLIYSLEAEP